MIISFERSGGFAGIRLFVERDTADLPEEKAKELEEIVEQTGFFDLPARSPTPSRGADYNTYLIRVQDGERNHEIKATDMSMPDGLAPLIKNLTDLALGR